MRFLLTFCLSLQAVAGVVTGPFVVSVGRAGATVEARLDSSTSVGTLQCSVPASTQQGQTLDCAVSDVSLLAVGDVVETQDNHEKMRLWQINAGVPRFARNYEDDRVSTWEERLLSVVGSAGSCRATVNSYSHRFAVGDAVTLVVRDGSGLSAVNQIVSARSATTFDFPCTGTGTAGDGTEVKRGSTSHSIGTAIKKLNSNAIICLGTAPTNLTTAYAQISHPQIPMGHNRFYHLTALAQSTIYYGQMVESFSAVSCPSAGSGVPTFSFTTLGESAIEMPDAARWDWSESGTVTTLADCAALTSAISGFVPGNQTWKLAKTARCSGIVLPDNTGFKATLRCDCVLPYGDRPIDTIRELPVITSSSTAAAIKIPSGWIIRGIETRRDLGIGAGQYSIDSLDGSSNDFKVGLEQPHNMAVIQCRIIGNDRDGEFRTLRLHGVDIAAIGNYIYSALTGNDAPGIVVDGFDSNRIYIRNNHVITPMSGIMHTDNSLNPRNVWWLNNWLQMSRKWNRRNSEWRTQVSENVTNVSGTVTLSKHGLVVGDVVLTSGATLNYPESVTAVAGVATVTKASHGLSPGDVIAAGGGKDPACRGWYSLMGVQTVPTADTFTVNLQSSDTFSFCKYTALSYWSGGVQVVNATPTDSTFTTSSGFTGTTVRYGKNRNVKNCSEFKSVVNAYVAGNVLDGCWSVNQSGQAFTVTPRGTDLTNGFPLADGTCWSCALTIRNLTIEGNRVLNACAGVNIFGFNQNGPSTGAENIRIAHNYFYLTEESFGNGTCTKALIADNGGVASLQIEDNFAQNRDGRSISLDFSGVQWPISRYVDFNRNTMSIATAPSNGVASGAGVLQGMGSASYSWLDWTFAGNTMFADWAQNAYFSDNPWANQMQYYNGSTYGSSGFVAANTFVNHSGLVGGRAVTITGRDVSALNCRDGDQLEITNSATNTDINGRWEVRAGLIPAGSGMSSGAYAVPLRGCGVSYRTSGQFRYTQ